MTDNKANKKKACVCWHIGKVLLVFLVICSLLMNACVLYVLGAGDFGSAVVINGKDGVDGKDGADGKDGRDGVDGVDGKDGINGQDGTNGIDGKDGINGIDGKDGRDGVDGVNGKDGVNGVDGKDGKDGLDGKNGTDGVDGKDGKDGLTPYIGSNGNWWIGGKDTGTVSTIYVPYKNTEERNQYYDANLGQYCYDIPLIIDKLLARDTNSYTYICYDLYGFEVRATLEKEKCDIARLSNGDTICVSGYLQHFTNEWGSAYYFEHDDKEGVFPTWKWYE